MKPYPLVTEPIFKEKVWGGRRLEALGKHLPPAVLIGESWELADLSSTSADGGGGGEARSMIAAGEMRGLSIHDAITALGHNLMGSLGLSREGGFPLLVKFLDARENLSVQVHPSAAYALAHAGAHLKTESWFVVAAEPGALIYKGIRQGVTREAFAAALRSGQDVTDMLLSVPALAGDFHHLPSGTCHALGAGVLVAEVQTPSDTTYRVFDWGRTGRALHIDEAMECIQFGPPPRLAAVRSDAAPRTMLVQTEAYALSRVKHLGGEEFELVNMPAPPIGRPMVWVCLSGEGRIESAAGEYRPVEFRAGTTVLFPAALGPSRVRIARDADLLEVRFPVKA